MRISPIPYPAAFVFRLAFPHSLLLLPIFIFFSPGEKAGKRILLSLSELKKLETKQKGISSSQIRKE